MTIPRIKAMSVKCREIPSSLWPWWRLKVIAASWCVGPIDIRQSTYVDLFINFGLKDRPVHFVDDIDVSVVEYYNGIGLILAKANRSPLDLDCSSRMDNRMLGYTVEVLRAAGELC
jgi:hypothetical protein